MVIYGTQDQIREKVPVETIMSVQLASNGIEGVEVRIAFAITPHGKSAVQTCKVRAADFRRSPWNRMVSMLTKSLVF